MRLLRGIVQDHMAPFADVADGLIRRRLTPDVQPFHGPGIAGPLHREPGVFPSPRVRGAASPLVQGQAYGTGLRLTPGHVSLPFVWSIIEPGPGAAAGVNGPLPGQDLEPRLGLMGQAAAQLGPRLLPAKPGMGHSEQPPLVAPGPVPAALEPVLCVVAVMAPLAQRRQVEQACRFGAAVEDVGRR